MLYWIAKSFYEWNEWTAMNELGTKITLSLCHLALWLLWWRMIILLVHLAKVLVKQEGLRYYVVSYLGTYLDGDRFRFTVILFRKLYIFDFCVINMRMSWYEMIKIKNKIFPYLYSVTIFLRGDSILPKDNEPYILWLTLKVMREEEEEQQQDEIILKLSCNSSNLLPKLG